MSQAPISGTAQAALLCQQSTWEPDAGHDETGVGQHSTRRRLYHTLFELRCFPSPPIGQCASCVTTPTKPVGKQTQATERRALDSIVPKARPAPLWVGLARGLRLKRPSSPPATHSSALNDTTRSELDVIHNTQDDLYLAFRALLGRVWWC